MQTGGSQLHPAHGVIAGCFLHLFHRRSVEHRLSKFDLADIRHFEGSKPKGFPELPTVLSADGSPVNMVAVACQRISRELECHCAVLVLHGDSYDACPAVLNGLGDRPDSVQVIAGILHNAGIFRQ